MSSLGLLTNWRWRGKPAAQETSLNYGRQPCAHPPTAAKVFPGSNQLRRDIRANVSSTEVGKNLGYLYNTSFRWEPAKMTSARRPEVLVQSVLG